VGHKKPSLRKIIIKVQKTEKQNEYPKKKTIKVGDVVKKSKIT
jgi:hypothetical protein